MSYYFLLGMHLVKSLDKDVAFQMFNELSDFSIREKNLGDEYVYNIYEYMRKNINNELVYVDKINVLIVPEMIVGTMTMHEYVVSKHKVIGFEPISVVPVLGSNDRVVQSLVRDMNPLELDDTTKVALVSFCGYTPKTIEEFSVIPMYYKNKLVYKSDWSGGNVMTLFNMDGEWDENIMVYYDLESEEFAFTKGYDALGGNLSKELYGQEVFGDVYGFYRLVYDVRLDNINIAGSNFLQKLGDYVYLYPDGSCTVDLTSIKSNYIIVPSGVTDIKIRFDNYKLDRDVTITIPPNFKSLDIVSLLTNKDKFKILFSTNSDLSAICDTFKIEPHTNDISVIKELCNKDEFNIEFY